MQASAGLGCGDLAPSGSTGLRESLAIDNEGMNERGLKAVTNFGSARVEFLGGADADVRAGWNGLGRGEQGE
jgi:hypothetical protein